MKSDFVRSFIHSCIDLSWFLQDFLPEQLLRKQTCGCCSKRNLEFEEEHKPGCEIPSSDCGGKSEISISSFKSTAIISNKWIKLSSPCTFAFRYPLRFIFIMKRSTGASDEEGNLEQIRGEKDNQSIRSKIMVQCFMLLTSSNALKVSRQIYERRWLTILAMDAIFLPCVLMFLT